MRFLILENWVLKLNKKIIKIKLKMHKELMGAKMDKLTNGSNKQEIKIIK